LGLAFLINQSESQLSLLFIYTSITFVFVGLLDNFGNVGANYQLHNYFQILPVNKKSEQPFTIKSLTLNGELITNRVLNLKTEFLEQIKINNHFLMDLESEIYDAQKAINFEDSIYNNIFNYQKGDLKMLRLSKTTDFINLYQLDLSKRPTAENKEIIQYLSCFFTLRPILILKKPANELAKNLAKNFPEKVIIFVDDSI